MTEAIRAIKADLRMKARDMMPLTADTGMSEEDPSIGTHHKPQHSICWLRRDPR